MSNIVLERQQMAQAYADAADDRSRAKEEFERAKAKLAAASDRLNNATKPLLETCGANTRERVWAVTLGRVVIAKWHDHVIKVSVRIADVEDSQ